MRQRRRSCAGTERPWLLAAEGKATPPMDGPGVRKMSQGLSTQGCLRRGESESLTHTAGWLDQSCLSCGPRAAGSLDMQAYTEVEVPEPPHAALRRHAMPFPLACFPYASPGVRRFWLRAHKSLILLEPTIGIEPMTC